MENSDTHRILKGTYENLTSCLDIVEEELNRLEDFCDRVSLIILEDDLTSLVEECEEYILVEDDVESESLESFSCRSLTVIDEVVDLLQNRILSEGEKGRIEKMILAHDLEKE